MENMKISSREELDQEARDEALAYRQELTQGNTASAARLRLEEETDQMTTVDRVGVKLNTENFLYRLAQRGSMEASLLFEPDEPGFDAKKALSENLNEIDPSLWKRAENSDSLLEFTSIMEMSKDQEHQRALAASMGASGTVASVLSSMVDIDAMAMFLSGGSYLGPKLAYGAARGTLGAFPRLAGAAYGAGAALEAGIATELGNRALGMGYEGQDIPTILATSLTFGIS